jgi:hypothetical protein
LWEKPSLLVLKFLNLCELLSQITCHLFPNKRPKCQEILERKEKWALIEHEMGFKIRIELISNHRFHYFPQSQNRLDLNSQRDVTYDEKGFTFLETSPKTSDRIEKEFFEIKKRFLDKTKLDLKPVVKGVERKPNPVSSDEESEQFLETKKPRLDLKVTESGVQLKPNPALSANQRTDGQNKS